MAFLKAYHFGNKIKRGYSCSIYQADFIPDFPLGMFVVKVLISILPRGPNIPVALKPLVLGHRQL